MKLPSPIALLSQSWKFYRSYFLTLLKLIVTPTLLTIIVIPLAIVIGLATNLIPGPTLAPLKLVIIIPVAIVALFITVIIGLLSQTSIYYFLAKPTEYQGIKSLYQQVKPLIGKFILTQTLAGLITVFGFILLIIPGIILSIRYIFVPFIVVLENKSGREALKQSQVYAQGKLWAILGRILLIGSISAILSFLTVQINQVVITTLIQLIIALVIGPIATIYLYQLYQSVRTTAATS